MTEQEWLTSDDPIRLMCGLEGCITDRKMSLFELACVESLRTNWPDPIFGDFLNLRSERLESAQLHALPFDERVHTLLDRVDVLGDISLQQGEVIFNAGGTDDLQLTATLRGWAAAYLLCAHLSQDMAWWDWFPILLEATAPAGTFRELKRAKYIATFRRNLPSLRCIVGNPFRPVELDPQWLTSTVVALARGIYDDRAFDRLPLLADALQDAGCEHADILGHCRGDGPHARGCWVVDLLLGKS